MTTTWLTVSQITQLYISCTPVFLQCKVYTKRTILSIEAENVDHSYSIGISSVKQLGVWKG